MGRCFRLILATVLLSLGVAASCQEVAIFVDNRSMVVQSHRVDGSWTYFKVGSGELAVPSASVLRIILEKTQGSPVQVFAQAPPSPLAPPSSPPVAVPSPWHPEAPGRVRPPDPLPQQDVEQDDDEDLSNGTDEEDKPPEPEPPPGVPPGQTAPSLPPGKMPPQPVLPSIFHQPQQPAEVKH